MPNTSITKASPGQQGFTLIEIIAVLVILGILAAVAVPRYFNMQDDAKDAAVEGALASCIGDANMQFAKNLTSGNSTSDAVENIDDPIDVGDFECSVGDGDGDDDDPVTIEVTDGPDWFNDWKDDADADDYEKDLVLTNS